MIHFIQIKVTLKIYKDVFHSKGQMDRKKKHDKRKKQKRQSRKSNSLVIRVSDTDN